MLSLPVKVADPAIYLLSGTLPIDAMIYHRVLTFFGNISRLSDSSTEKRLAERQLAVKSLDSHSWFVVVKKLWIRYGLPDCTEILKNYGQNTHGSLQLKQLSTVTGMISYSQWVHYNQALNG